MKSIIYTLLVIKKKQIFVVCLFFTSVSMFRMDRRFFFCSFSVTLKFRWVMIHTLQNLPTVSEGNKSNDKRRTDKSNLKKEVFKWVWGRDIYVKNKRIISEVTARQWVLFLQPTYTVKFPTCFYRLWEKETKHACTFSPGVSALAYWLDSADVQRFYFFTGNRHFLASRQRKAIKCISLRE